MLTQKRMQQDIEEIHITQQIFREKQKRDLEEEDRRIKEYIAERDKKMEEETERKKEELKRKEEMGNKLGYDIVVERVSAPINLF